MLGGGLVAGAVVLIGGDPGIGKSTLLLSAIANLSSGGGGCYVTGEESLDQIGLRADRLGVGKAPVQLLSETCVEGIIGTLSSEPPDVLVIDSIQTLFSEHLESAPGSVAQLRNAPRNWFDLPSSRRSPPSWWVMSPRKVPWPDPGCSSTWSTPFFTLKAISAVVSGLSVRRRIVSAPPMNWGSSS